MLFLGYAKWGKIADAEDWKRCAHLAIVWNDVKAGRKRIFNGHNDQHLVVVDVTLFTFALIT